MLEFLREIAPYNQLDSESLEAFARSAVQCKFRKNMLVIQQGDETDTLYILLDGRMRVFIEDDQDRELTVRFLQPGDSFGELALLGEFPRSPSVMALTDCVVSVVSSDDYLKLLRDSPEISLSMIKTLANMVRETTEELSHIALSDVYGRLVHVLEKHVEENDGERRVPRYTHRDFANMIGSSREMVSKILKELEKGDYLTVDGDSFVINRDLPARL